MISIFNTMPRYAKKAPEKSLGALISRGLKLSSIKSFFIMLIFIQNALSFISVGFEEVRVPRHNRNSSRLSPADRGTPARLWVLQNS